MGKYLALGHGAYGSLALLFPGFVLLQKGEKLNI